jgi:hypothetical protein
MELGNMLFGHSRGEFPVNRHVFQEIFLKEFAYKVGCDSYGYFNNGKDYGYENDVFKVMPYDWDAECTCSIDDEFEKWCESNYHKEDCRLLRPNFWYKPTNFTIMWYKYALRDAYMNQDISVDEFRKILEHCVKSYFANNKTFDKI